MDSYGCPLCCQQKFNSIVALREHLLYFTFRPLLCVLCRMTIGGIYELTRHLETHLIREKNSTADVLRNVRQMDKESCLPEERIRVDTCNASEVTSENIDTGDIYGQSMVMQSQYETSSNANNDETKLSTIVKCSSNSLVDPYNSKLSSFTKLPNEVSAEISGNEAVKYIDGDYASISTTTSEYIFSDSNSENLSIGSLSENESVADQEFVSHTNENADNCTDGDSVRAFVCHECGTKIVGKDYYFSHLQEHTDKSENKVTTNGESLPDVPLQNQNCSKESAFIRDNAIPTQNANIDIYTSNKNQLCDLEEISVIGCNNSVQQVEYSKCKEAPMLNDIEKLCSVNGEECLTESNTIVSISKTSFHYIHKKFDHDQERKFEGLSSNSDVQCYIQNFQSLLVNKLNQAFENNELKSLPTAIDCEAEQEKNDSPPLEVTKSSKSKYHCRYCTKPFVWKQTRDTHELNGKCNIINKCKHCDKDFVKSNTLARHEQEAHADDVFFCDVCGRHFKSLRYLTNHKGVHDKKRYPCKKCKSCFHTASGLRSHMYEIHSLSQKGKEISCEHCGEKFKRKYGLQRHTERKHSSMKFSCRYCNKELPCKEDLSSHMIIHLHSDSLCCSICDMTFTSQSSLKRHREKHKNASNSFQCKTCLTVFTRKDSLISHIQTQHGSTPKYICKCGKAFNKASHLKYHEVKHSKEPPQFRCEYCLKTFKYKISLKKHNCKEKKS